MRELRGELKRKVSCLFYESWLSLLWTTLLWIMSSLYYKKKWWKTKSHLQWLANRKICAIMPVTVNCKRVLSCIRWPMAVQSPPLVDDRSNLRWLAYRYSLCQFAINGHLWEHFVFCRVIDDWWLMTVDSLSVSGHLLHTRHKTSIVQWSWLNGHRSSITRQPVRIVDS